MTLNLRKINKIFRDIQIFIKLRNFKIWNLNSAIVRFTFYVGRMMTPNVQLTT